MSQSTESARRATKESGLIHALRKRQPAPQSRHTTAVPICPALHRCACFPRPYGQKACCRIPRTASKAGTEPMTEGCSGTIRTHKRNGSFRPATASCRGHLRGHRSEPEHHCCRGVIRRRQSRPFFRDDGTKPASAGENGTSAVKKDAVPIIRGSVSGHDDGEIRCRIRRSSREACCTGRRR